MTVKELIEVLASYDQNAVVRVIGLNQEDEYVFEPVTSSCQWSDIDGSVYVDL